MLLLKLISVTDKTQTKNYSQALYGKLIMSDNVKLGEYLISLEVECNKVSI